MTQNNRIWVLISRRLSGEATPAEIEELHHLLDQDADKQYLYGILQVYFTDQASASTTQPEEDADLERRFRKIVAVPDIDPAIPATPAIPASGAYRFSFRRGLGYAAAVAACIFLTWAVYLVVRSRGADSSVARPVHNEEVLAKAGARTRLVLPDGTQVWLNSNSKLKYDKEFNVQDREVMLEGEAFFEVSKNAVHPFIVHAATLDIEVLGTSFTVKSYPQDATVEATLLRGAIEVRRKGIPSTARVILKPNEKLVFSRSAEPDSGALVAGATSNDRHSAATGMAVDHIRTDIPDSAKVETAWMYNRLVFDGDNFQELATELERWYDVTISVRDERLNHYHFTGAFANETIEEVLKDLQLTADFTYKIHGKEIELYAKR